MGKHADKDDGGPQRLEEFDKDQKVVVAEGGGYLYNLTLNAKVLHPPQEIYKILTDPNSANIFRGIKECSHRKVCEEDKRKGTRKLEVVHKAIARFLFLTVNFETRLWVWEDDRNHMIKFQIAQEGMMKKFDGTWRIQPFTQESVDNLYYHRDLHHGGFNPASFLTSLQSRFLPAPSSSLVTLEQNILPKGNVPPGLRGLVRGLCAKQIKDMMEDLRNELDRREKRRREQEEKHTAGVATGTAHATKKQPGSSGSNGSGSGGAGSQAGKAASLSCAAMPLLAWPAPGSSSSRPLALWDSVAPLGITIKLN